MDHEFPPEWKRGVYEVIMRRRDMRSFKPNPIPKDVLSRILHAANEAGSVGFMQPWNFILVENLDTRQRIRNHVDDIRLQGAGNFKDERQDTYLKLKLEGIVDSPLNICVTCDGTRNGPHILGRNSIPETDVYSTCGAIQNLWLAARAEGVGVGWVSLYEPNELRRILDIPDHVIPVAYLCMGYVEEFPKRPLLETIGWLPKRNLDQAVFSEVWNQPAEADLQEHFQRFEFAQVADNGEDLGSVDCENRMLTVRFRQKHRVLSWAISNGGWSTVNRVVWHEVKNKELPIGTDPKELLEERLKDRDLAPAVGFLTSHPVDNFIEVTHSRDDLTVRCIATVGMSNALRVGDPPAPSRFPGTINILCIVSLPLCDNAYVEAISIAAEARTAACLANNVASIVSNTPATGTGTDCIGISAPNQENGLEFAGKHTTLGHLTGTTVTEAIDVGIKRWLLASANRGKTS